MKSLALAALCLAATLILATAASAQTAPSQIAGLSLGANSEDLRDRLDVSRIAPLWDRPWLMRANLKPTKGFRAGYVLFGDCAASGRVLRVKLQYKDAGKALFDKLAASLTARYGKPAPLPSAGGKSRALRWVFGKSKAEGVDLLLEHVAAETEEATAGTTIRLTDNRGIAAEKACYAAMLKREPEVAPPFPLFEVDEAWLLPK